jgi:peptide/nickel transport system substrate-binding protein
MEIRLLGLVGLRLDGDDVALGAAKQRAVLAMLALHANERVSADRLAEGLWGEQPPPSAAKMVQIYVSRLRKLLGGGEAEILTRGRGYELRIPADCVDAVRFERLVESASRNGGDANGAVREALSLWRGPPLDDVADEPFAAAEIRRLEELWLRARELAIDEALAAGEHNRVIGELEELVARHPLRERLHAQRMLALYGCGRQAEALEAYRYARELLVGEIGVEPGPELRRVHEAILRQDPSLAPTVEVRVPGEPRGAPATDAVPRHERRMRALVLAAVLVAVGGVAFIVGQLAASDGLDQIDANAVGLIDPADGRITAQYAVGRDPGALAAGGGSVWVASAAAGTVSRIDRSSEQVTTIDVGGEPTALAFAAGSLWVADGEHRRLAQIDSGTNRVMHRFPVGNSPRGVDATPDAVWVASAVDGRIDRIDLKRGGRIREVELQGGPAAVAAGAGAVWVASEDAGIVTRLEPRTGAALEVVGVGNAPTALTVAYGAVWVANRADGTVSRIDPRTNAVTDTIPIGGSPVAIAAAADRVWVADPSRGLVARIDPGTRRLEGTVDVGSSPTGLAFADGSLWTSALAPPTSHRGGTLRFKTGAFDTIDPTAYDGRNSPVLSLAYDGLLAYRRVAGTAGTALVGNLATGVPEPVDGGRTYVFQLRRHVRFSDGSKVRPQDFRESMERLLRLAGPGIPPFFAGIVGAESCDRRACDLRKGIETDPRSRTITIHLRKPEPEFPHKLAFPLAYVVPAGSPVRLARARALPGTGPYRIVAFDPARGGRLTRNPHFLSSSAGARPDGFPDEIAFSFTRQIRAAVSAVRQGRADVVQVGGGSGDELSLKDLRALAISDPSHLHSAATPHTEYLFLNVREPPFDDVRVRRALNFAVDRRHVVRLVGPRLAEVTCQLIPSGMPGHEPVCPYTRGPAATGGWTAPDLSRASKLVAESGTTGARVDVWGARGWSEDVVRYAARVLRQLGYRARARFKPDIGQYFMYLAANPPQAGYTGWIADFLTPSNFIAPTLSCDQTPHDTASNPSRFCDARLDSLIDRATASDGSEANELWAEADRRIVRAAPIVPLVNRRSVLFFSDRVGNVQQHPQLGPLLDQLWVR